MSRTNKTPKGTGPMAHPDYPATAAQRWKLNQLGVKYWDSVDYTRARANEEIFAIVKKKPREEDIESIPPPMRTPYEEGDPF